jgi:hypothetical protein
VHRCARGAEGTEISADFVRMVELQSDYRVKVIRNFPATGYKVQAASDGVRTWVRAWVPCGPVDSLLTCVDKPN